MENKNTILPQQAPSVTPPVPAPSTRSHRARGNSAGWCRRQSSPAHAGQRMHKDLPSRGEQQRSWQNNIFSVNWETPRGESKNTERICSHIRYRRFGEATGPSHARTGHQLLFPQGTGHSLPQHHPALLNCLLPTSLLHSFMCFISPSSHAFFRGHPFTFNS